MPAYLNAESDTAESRLERFKALTTLADAQVDELDALYPGWCELQFQVHSAWIDGRLRKRYAAPFVAPYPLILEMWLAALVTLRANLKLGVRQTDEQFQTATDDAKQTREDVQEAADAKDGLFDLPLRANTTEGGISATATIAQVERSPYVAFDGQRLAGQQEDQTGRASRV